MPNKFYDLLKVLALVVLPVAGALYFTLGKILDWPNVREIVGTIVVVNAVLGTLVYLSARVWMNSDIRFDGQMDIQEHDNGKVVQMAFDDENQLETLTDKKEVRFKINQVE